MVLAGSPSIVQSRSRVFGRMRSSTLRAELIEFITFVGRAPVSDGIVAWLLVGCGRKTVRARTAGSSKPRRSGRLSLSDFACGSPSRRVSRFVLSYFWLTLAAFFLFLLRRGDIHFSKGARRNGASSPGIVVTRAMGGFGDLLMMTPGLRALSKAHSTRVKLLIERKFFDLFQNNPHIDLIDIDGPPIDVIECKTWYNLTLCPAGRYEASRRPFARKGRVELFARGMGVNERTLDRYGWGVECVLDHAQIAFRDDFIRQAGFGARPIVGVQPYSRDSYKDHLDIARFVEALRAVYDVIVFHHVETSLTVGPGITSTAGLSLGQSVALVSALQAMVCMDSGFLHAASAFDVPVVAMFGPTDGKLFTRHHLRATVISNESFPCAPCWRNEDLPCQLTGQFGPSPCIAALRVDTVLDAVGAILRPGIAATVLSRPI